MIKERYGSGPIFYLWIRRASADWRCYICNVFSHWLRICSATEIKRPLGWGLLHQFLMCRYFPIFRQWQRAYRMLNITWYLTGVGAVQLWWHPSNMKGIQRDQQVFSQKYFLNGEFNERLFSPTPGSPGLSVPAQDNEYNTSVPTISMRYDGFCWYSRFSFSKKISKYNKCNRPLTRYIKLRVVHAPGMPGTFSPPLPVSDPDMDHGTCLTHVPWCMPGSLTSGFLWSQLRRKRSRHSRRMRNPQFHASGKRPIVNSNYTIHKALCGWNISTPGPRLNIKTVFPSGDSRVKDKTVGETVLSLAWESVYW